MPVRPIDWRELARLATKWSRTGKFPEVEARVYWWKQGLRRGRWVPGSNVWR